MAHSAADPAASARRPIGRSSTVIVRSRGGQASPGLDCRSPAGNGSDGSVPTCGAPPPTTRVDWPGALANAPMTQQHVEANYEVLRPGTKHAFETFYLVAQLRSRRILCALR